MAARHQEDFEWPHSPPRDQSHEVLILKDDSLIGGPLRFNVVAEQAVAGAGKMVALCVGLGGWFVGHKAGGPDLTVRVRVAGAHHSAAILKDLHVLDPVQTAELNILAGPCFDDW